MVGQDVLNAELGLFTFYIPMTSGATSLLTTPPFFLRMTVCYYKYSSEASFVVLIGNLWQLSVSLVVTRAVHVLASGHSGICCGHALVLGLFFLPLLWSGVLDSDLMGGDIPASASIGNSLLGSCLNWLFPSGIPHDGRGAAKGVCTVVS
ncbi:hypothetical protein Tco_0924164, partial [Tanacetum coccineum]